MYKANNASRDARIRRPFYHLFGSCAASRSAMARAAATAAFAAVFC